MVTQIIPLLAILNFVNSEILYENNNFHKRQYGGMDDLRDLKIDKDTIITTNFPPHSKNSKPPTFNKKTYKQLDEEAKLKVIKKMILNKNNKSQSQTSGSASIPNAVPEKPAPKLEPVIEQDPDWSYKPIPKEVNAYVNDFRQNMTECLKEVQDKQPVLQMSPKVASPLNGECLIACVLRKSGVIQDGLVRKDNLLNLVNKFYAKETHLMRQLDRNVDRCIESSSRVIDECKRAALLNDCTNELININKPKLNVKY